MITHKDIKLSLKAIPSPFSAIADTVVTASLRCEENYRIAGEVLRMSSAPPSAVIEHAEGRCKEAIMHTLYGDLRKDLNELRRVVYYNIGSPATFAAFTELKQLHEQFSAIFKKLEGNQ